MTLLLQGIQENDFQSGSGTIISWKCIASQGEYFEGDSSC
jgi:hypothetical protein